MSNVVVRFAPSPTGIPHVGNIRTALFDYFFAKAKGGKFILRIEDTDQARKMEGAEEMIKGSLEFLGAYWDEFVVQSQRIDEYKKYSQELLDKGFAQKEDNGAIRFNINNDKLIEWTDLIGNKQITFDPKDIEDFIILKADGYPTYHLANVVDDHLMGITHVIRGEDWIPSTPKHILLYDAFGWEKPNFAHVPNVMGTDGKKLSKRRGAKSVLDFKTEGILPDALLNYIMLLGWSPKDDREILSKEEIEREFKLENVNVSPAIIDERKLLWMNGEYIRKSENTSLLTLLHNFDESLKEFDQIMMGKLIDTAKTRMKTLVDFKKLIMPFLVRQNLPSSKIKTDLAKKFERLKKWEKDDIFPLIGEVLKENNLKLPDLYESIIGERQGLPLAETFEIIGKENTLKLLE